MAVVVRKAHHPLYYDLGGIVGPKYVTDEDVVLETYSRDTSPLPPNKQGIVVRPSCTDEVVDIVKLANATKIPIVPSGGRASFYGTPKGLHGKGIVVDMTRMNKMLNFDEYNLTVTAEAGMTTSEFSTYIWDRGWDVHTAFQPFYPDTLGGQIAGFAGGGGGMELFVAGFNATHIPGVKVVLPDGSIVQTGAGAGSNVHCDMIYDRYPGNPDLTGMFIGDAGTFGIKVEATYRMYKDTPIRVPLAFDCDSWDQAYDYCRELSVVEPLPYYCMAIIVPVKIFQEMMGMKKHMCIIIAKGTTQKETDAKLEIIKDLASKHSIEEATHAAAEDWKKQSLDGQRHREMGEFGSLGTWAFFEYYIARSQVAACHQGMRDFIYDRLNKEGVAFNSNETMIPTGSAAWIVSMPVWTKGEDPHARQVMQQLFLDATEFACSNGWYPDCHQGWGTRMMAKFWPKERFDFMRKLKKAFDPNNIMNPGIWDL